MTAHARALETTELVDRFQAATAAQVALEMTPRWRRRKRKRLTAERDEAAARADRKLEELGLVPGATPTPLATILKDR